VTVAGAGHQLFFDHLGVALPEVLAWTGRSFPTVMA
jgi:hypothetical protein